jgi:4-hydroxy-tetrahydrodipicolinate reductase
MKTHLAISGVCGRMGQRVLALASEDPQFHIAAGLEHPAHPSLGRDLGELAGRPPSGVPVTAEIPITIRIDCVIDFSTPAGTMNLLRTCVDRQIPMIIATTGFTTEELAEIQAAAHHTAVLQAPNLSLVVNILFKLAGMTASVLAGRGFDVEIIERHHRYKKDSPSGTALEFARIIQAAMGQSQVRHGREGLIGERPPHEIGIHAVRIGDNVGEHTIIFGAPGETLELVHKATSRDSYARGALEAAKFLANKGAGSYTMADVLGL